MDASLAFPSLTRPEYPPSPEVFLSALAWSTMGARAEDGTHGSLGLTYRGNEKQAQSYKIVATDPSRPNVVGEFSSHLQRTSFLGEIDESLQWSGASALAEALLGTKPERGRGSTTSAVGYAAALMQNSIGSLVKESPPNFAKLINTIYSLGSRATQGDSGFPSASHAWFSAAQQMASRPDLSAIEQSLFATSLTHVLPNVKSWPPKNATVLDVDLAQKPPIWWEGMHEEVGWFTPFGWFYSAWNNLCSPEWVAGLPPRRWAGWATCVLRHAIAFAFLWEANFFVEITRALLRGSDLNDSALSAVSPKAPLISWSQGSISEMDVKPMTRSLLRAGLACRMEILALVDALSERNAESLPALLGALGAALGDDQRLRLSAALTGRTDPPAWRNLQFTVEYALLDRGSAEATIDQYSLLRTVSKRFAHVAPGSDWVVVMAAINARTPISKLRLGDMLLGLRRLGLAPRLDFLSREAERAGLCASAADGDEGIVIDLGFGR